MTAGADDLLPVLKAALPFVERVASGETTRTVAPDERLEAIQLAQDIRRLAAEREAQS